MDKFEALWAYQEEDMKADAIAAAMKEWALSKGATHYAHWFQPRTEVTAERHIAFLNLDLRSNGFQPAFTVFIFIGNNGMVISSFILQRVFHFLILFHLQRQTTPFFRFQSTINGFSIKVDLMQSTK